MTILELVKQSSSDENRIGNVFTENSYGIDRISVTLKEGVQLNTGSYVFLLDGDSYPVVYQVVQPYWFRPSFDFEESLITIGNPTADSRIQRYRCACTLVGKLTEDAFSPPRNPVKPFANVYSCSPEMVAKVIHPDSDWTAKLGTNPETDREVLIDLNTLVRQGLILTGAQGTGKTTGLLTLVSRAMQATPPARFLMLDWTGIPEGGSREDIDRIWFKLATEGGRNGCPLLIVARRLALVNKTITIEAQQNMISFNTEDIDRHRIESDLGSDFAGMLGALSPGEAMASPWDSESPAR
jgi:DNA helicase HerA-like ATPase